jgi:hypothetical protein
MTELDESRLPNQMGDAGTAPSSSSSSSSSASLSPIYYSNQIKSDLPASSANISNETISQQLAQFQNEVIHTISSFYNELHQ